jgi:hypothetical protein
MFSDVFLQKAHFDVPEMNKPLYNVIMFNKVYWIKDCVDKGYFDNDFVIWADAGGLREPVEVYQGKVWPNIEKINNLDNNKITFSSCKLYTALLLFLEQFSGKVHNKVMILSFSR